jgi:hypothetical protein
MNEPSPSTNPLIHIGLTEGNFPSVEVENFLVELEIIDRDIRPLLLCIENRDTALFRNNPGNRRRNCSIKKT